MERFYIQYCGARQKEWLENHGKHLIHFKKTGIFNSSEVCRYPLHNNMDIKAVSGGDNGFVRVRLRDTEQELTFYIYQKAESLAYEIRINNGG